MRMLRIASMGVAALLVAPLLAQGSILPYLPKTTAMAVSVPDLGASMGEFSGMPLAKMWAEPQVQAFFADALGKAKAQIDGLMEQAKEQHKAGAIPIDPETLLSLRVNGGTFAITRLEMGEHEGRPKVNLGLVLHLDFGATAAQWNGLVQMGLGLMEQQAGPMLNKREAKIGDVPLLTYAPAHQQGSDMSLNIATVKNGLLIGTLEDDVKSILENMQKGTPVLTATDAYKANAQHLLAKGAECEMFMRLDPMMDFGLAGLELASKMEPNMAAIDVAGIGRACEALGLRAIKSIGATSTYEKGRCITKGYVASPAPERKGLTGGASKTLDTSFLKWVPKDAVVFSAWTMEPMGIYDGLVGALTAYDPKTAEMALGQLAEMEKQLGFTIREDLFGSLGDHVIRWSMAMGAITSTPEVAFLVKVKDQDKVVKVLKGLAALTNNMVEITESTKREVKAYTVRVNFDPSGGQGMNPFDMISPTISFKNGYMVAGFSASDIKRTFQRMDREDDPKGDIRSNKEFMAFADSLPKDVQSLKFTDWKAEFESYYQMATGLLALVPANEEIPFDMSQLPEVGSLTKHLSGGLAYEKADATGFESTAISPFGPEVMLIGVGVAAAVGGFAVAMRGRF